MKCTKCGGVNFRKKGKTMNSTGTYQLLQCINCAKCRIGDKVKDAII